MAERYFTARRIAKLGIFSALAVILYFLNFPLPFFPSFLEIHLSDLPALICGFSMGPLGGFLVILVKILIKLPFSSTMCVGELADLITGSAFVLPASFLYKNGRTRKSAVIGMLIGSLCSVATAVVSNWLIIIPFYLNVMHVSIEALAEMCSSVIPFITAQNFYACYIPLSVIPFNLLRCLIASLVTFFVYKRVSTLLKKF
ncbi:MAG: ECF transporter S component [Clostridia bacterium]|nr:ECF transporter S component [Clostridia bacterium]